MKSIAIKLCVVYGLISLGLSATSSQADAQPPYHNYYPPGGYYPPPSYPVGSGYPVDPGFGYVAPRSVLIESKIIPAAPLPPARLVFSHRRNETLRVQIYDRQRKRAVFEAEIPAGESVEVTLPRDAGGEVEETYQSIDGFGFVTQRVRTRTLPIEVRYDVTVHRWQIQSIAIDRTGKSPSAVEDIQYQGQGVGRFSLPPGPQLTDGQIDVYRNAVSSRNEGAVQPIQPPQMNDGPDRDPLLEALQGLRR